jgi:transposase
MLIQELLWRIASHVNVTHFNFFCAKLKLQLFPTIVSTTLNCKDRPSRIITPKKTYRSEKVITPEVQQGRVDYWAKIRDVAPDKLVFIDETGFWIGMSRTMARALQGRRAYHWREFYRGQKVTLIGAIKHTEILVTKTLAGSIKGDDFGEFIKTDLAPRLQAGEVVVMDNLNSHHRADITQVMESVGASVVYLPVYSPEFNPIEMMWSQIKSFVRKFRTRTLEALTKVIEVATSLIHAEFLNHWFTKCCYWTE